MRSVGWANQDREAHGTMARDSKKAQALAKWQALTPGQDPLRHMIPLPYKASGSTYGACGIRIDGNPEFVDAVLSNLQALIPGENHVTRLGLSRQEVDGSGIGKVLKNTDRMAEVVYIRLHMRGQEGAIASAVFDRHLAGATEHVAKLWGLEDEA